MRGKQGSGPRGWGSGPHHVAASCAAVAFLPLHPLREAARLQGLRNLQGVVGLAAPPSRTTVIASVGGEGKRAPDSAVAAFRLGKSAAAGRSGLPQRLLL